MEENNLASTSNDSKKDALVPSDASMTNLAGAFISIRAANKAIKLQPDLTLPDNDDGSDADFIANLRGVNVALKTAQIHADHWNNTVSANVQNQLQQVVNQSEFYSSLADPLKESIDHVKTQEWGSNEMLSNLNDIHDLAEAVAENINTILYGAGKTINDYGDSKTDYPTDTIYGAYKQLRGYQNDVGDDKKAFNNYIEKLIPSDAAGINAEIENLNNNISAYRTAISNDQAMIAGGSAAIVTGVVLVVCAVALAPESGGASMAIGVVGVAAIAGGVAADTYGVIDLMKKEDKIVEAKRRIQELNADQAAVISIKDASQGMEEHTNIIYNALDQIVTNWQQMQNNIKDTMIAVKSIDDPNGNLQKWIDEAQSGNLAPSKPGIMSIILNAKLSSPASTWKKAADKAQSLLNGIANTIEKVLPANAEINQQTINNIAKAA